MRILIPNVNEEERLGSSFNHLIRVIRETENSRDGIVWDFSNVYFLHPCFLAPLAIYRIISEKTIKCINASFSLGHYLDTVYFSDPLHFESNSSQRIKQLLGTYSDKSYIPVCSFAMSDDNKDTFGSIVRDIIVRQANIPQKGINPISYFIGELFDNIYEHSESKRGFVFSQFLPKEGCIYLCIADEGITIYNSFKKANLFQKEIDGDESVALSLANGGCSTKNRPSAENRGYGISTSKNMLVKGLHGAFFMLSGGAFHRYEKEWSDYIDIHNIFRWKGTVILMKIPVRVPAIFNFYDYIQ